MTKTTHHAPGLFRFRLGKRRAALATNSFSGPLSVPQVRVWVTRSLPEPYKSSHKPDLSPISGEVLIGFELLHSKFRADLPAIQMWPVPEAPSAVNGVKTGGG